MRGKQVRKVEKTFQYLGDALLCRGCRQPSTFLQGKERREPLTPRQIEATGEGIERQGINQHREEGYNVQRKNGDLDPF
jgi:hypothetical protein